MIRVTSSLMMGRLSWQCALARESVTETEPSETEDAVTVTVACTQMPDTDAPQRSLENQNVTSWIRGLPKTQCTNWPGSVQAGHGVHWKQVPELTWIRDS
jgi:hypothetical protein